MASGGAAEPGASLHTARALPVLAGDTCSVPGMRWLRVASCPSFPVTGELPRSHTFHFKTRAVPGKPGHLVTGGGLGGRVRVEQGSPPLLLFRVQEIGEVGQRGSPVSMCSGPVALWAGTQLGPAAAWRARCKGLWAQLCFTHCAW